MVQACYSIYERACVRERVFGALPLLYELFVNYLLNEFKSFYNLGITDINEYRLNIYKKMQGFAGALCHQSSTWLAARRTVRTEHVLTY
jgi:hypothetical protein